jgi:hypothetical protein
MAYNSGYEKSKKIFLYNKKDYSDFVLKYENYINFIDFTDKEKTNYAFKNTNNLDILPKNNKIVFDDEYDIVAFDFVLVAYKELARKYYSYLKSGQISNNSVLNSCISNPKKSQVGLNMDELLKNNKKLFNKKIISNFELALQTKNVFDYISCYIDNLPTFKTPIQTKMKYLNTKRDRNFSALTINLIEDNCNSDNNKVNFMKDINFPVLRKLAEQYGFYINSNIPWQLIANLSHNNIKTIIKNLYPDNNITTEFILAEYYDILLFQDYEEQKDFFLKAYSELYDNRDEFTQAIYCSESQTTSLKQIERIKPPIEDSYLKTDEIIFLNIYLRLLNSEYKNKYNIMELNRISVQLSKLYKATLDKQQALVYIYSNFDKVVV